jgi:hypothetical protein
MSQNTGRTVGKKLTGPTARMMLPDVLIANCSGRPYKEIMVGRTPASAVTLVRLSSHPHASRRMGGRDTTSGVLRRRLHRRRELSDPLDRGRRRSPAVTDGSTPRLTYNYAVPTGRGSHRPDYMPMAKVRRPGHKLP